MSSTSNCRILSLPAIPPFDDDMSSLGVKPAEFGLCTPFGLDKIVWDGGTSTGAGIGLEADEGVFDRLEEEDNEAGWSLDTSTWDMPGGRGPLPL